jgi:hypothetical protein
MQRRSPTLEGLQIMFRWPALGLAEIAWRWSFSLAVAASLAFSVGQVLATLPVTPGELLLLRTRQPVLIWQAIARIFRGSAPQVIASALVLTLALTLGWIVLAALGRAATVRALFAHFRQLDGNDSAADQDAVRNEDASWHLGSLMGLNCFRAVITLAGGVGTLGAMLMAAVSAPQPDPSPARALLIFFILTMLVGLTWTVLNWLFSLAAVFVVGQGRGALAALAAAVDLWRTQCGRLAAAGTSFGLVHLLAFVIATSAVGLPLGFAGVFPAAALLGGVLMVTLLYFAIVDFLYIGRLAAYVCMVAQPPAPLQLSPVSLPPPVASLPCQHDIAGHGPDIVPRQPLGG